MNLARRITMICLLFALMLLSGCTKAQTMVVEQEPVVYDTAPIPLEDFTDVSIVSIRTWQKTLRCKFRNEADNTLSMVHAAYLEVKQNDNWYRLKKSEDSELIAYHDMYYNLSPHKTGEQQAWLPYYGLSRLPKGQYRLTFLVCIDATPPETWVYIPFEID